MSINQTENFETSGNDISIKELISKSKNYINFLKTKWLLIFFVGCLGALAGFVYAYFQKPVFIAEMTYALEDEKSGNGLSGALGLASSLGIDLGTSGGGAFASSNLMELMHSRSLIEKTLLSNIEIEGKQITLADYYIKVRKLKSDWDAFPELVKLSFPINSNRKEFTRLQDSILGIIYTSIDENQLTISQKDKKVTIGTIEVKSKDEMFSKLFCEGLAREVTNFYIDSRSKKAKLNVQILEKQADSIRTELNNAITGVASANDNTYNLNPSLNIKRTPSAKRQVDVQANTAILTQLVTNLEMAKVTLRKETPLIQIIDAPILPLKKEKTSKLKSLVFGGIFFSFFVIVYISSKKIFQGLIS